MKKKLAIGCIICIFLSIIGVFFFTHEFNSNEMKECEINNEVLKDIEKRIFIIDDYFGTLESPNLLLSLNEFHYLADEIYSNHYYCEIIAYIEDPNKSETRKTILLYSLNKMELEEYLDIFEYCIMLYKKEIISDNVLFAALYPGPYWNNTIIKNYKDERVRKILKRNMSKLQDDYLKEFFEDTLSGLLWLDLQEHREMYNIKPYEL